MKKARSITVILMLGLMLGLAIEKVQAEGETALIAYNTITGILEGNIWEYTTPVVLEQRLREFAPDRPCFLMGTTLNYYRIGELVGFGTVGRPEFYWCNPEYPYHCQPLQGEKLGVAALMVCDPEDRIELTVPAGVNLHQEIIRQLREKRIGLAVLAVEGTFREVGYSIAFQIEKKGIDPQNPSTFTAAYQDKGPVEWRLMGVLATDARFQPLLTYGGNPCHLHGKQKFGPVGGHVMKAIPEQVKAYAYPISHSEVNLADLVLEVVAANDQRIVLKASNRGLAHCDHIKVSVTLADGKSVAGARLSTLAPGEAEFLELRPSLPIQGTQVTFRIDPDGDILESNEANNTVVSLIK